MRTRIGNFHNEAHGKNLRQHDFIADGSKTPEQILAATELATGLVLHGGEAVGQYGYISTSRPGRSGTPVFVSIVLYEACALDDCPAGHGSVERPDGTIRPGTKHVRAPDLALNIKNKMKVACGEDQKHRLTGDPTNDTAVLAELGWHEDEQGRKRRA